MSNIPESVRDVLHVFGDQEPQKRRRDAEKVRAREDAERAEREAARGDAESHAWKG